MHIKIILLLSVINLITAEESDYTNLEETSHIDINTYGTKAAQGIRAIGRSYAYNLMGKEEFTTYVTTAKGYFEDSEDDPTAGAQLYAKKYKMHLAVVGGGILLAIFLFFGFLLSWCCCLCCNKTQKQSSAMAMWRMIWGSILIVLLAANIAGIAIAVVSGSEILTLGKTTNDTIDTLGDGVVKYLKETEAQIESLKTEQFQIFLGKMKPVVSTIVNATSAEIKGSADPDFNGYVINIVQALNDLDDTLDSASTSITQINDDITALEQDIDTINTHLGTCESAISGCVAALCAASTITAADFDAPFDKSSLAKGDIVDVQTAISGMQTVNSKTIAEWATEVENQWNDLENFLHEESESARTGYTDTLDEADTQFTTTLQTDVQDKLEEMRTKVTESQEDAKETLTATYNYILKLMVGKIPASDDSVPEVLVDNKEIAKLVFMEIFIFVVILVAFLILTVLIGLGSTILGCCKVDDDLPSTERKTGVCGCLLMATSYCSIILCAIATLSAALMITMVMVEEGLCKQQADGTLITGLQGLAEDFADMNIEEEIQKSLDTTIAIDIDSVMKKCKAGDTLVTALNIQKTTEINGFSIDSLMTQIDDEIDKFDVATMVGDLDFSSFQILDDATKTSLNTQKDSLTSTFDYATVIVYLTTKTNSIGDIDVMITDLGTLAGSLTGADQTNVLACKTGVEEIKTLTSTTSDPKGNVELKKASLTTELTNVKDNIAPGATTQVDALITNVDGLQTELFEGTFIQDTLIINVNAGITAAKEDTVKFIDYLFEQFQKTVLGCQPVAAVYETSINYACDGIFIHMTLLYLSLSFIGISLLFYMCVSRCLARYFIKFSRLHPGDDFNTGNGWSNQPVLVHSGLPTIQNPPPPGSGPQTYIAKPKPPKKRTEDNQVLEEVTVVENRWAFSFRI